MSASPSVASSPPASPSLYSLDSAPPQHHHHDHHNDDDKDEEGEAVPAKRMRYDKLGREVDAATVAAVKVAKPLPVATATTSTATTATTTATTSAKSVPLKRPRGRTPKGMVWDDKRGFVTEGLRSFKL